MNERRTTGLVWGICGAVAVAAAASATINGVRQGWRGLYLATGIVEAMLPILLAVLAGLILARRPGNTIGWLMLAITGVFVTPLPDFSLPPAEPTIGFLVALWFSNWSWLLLIFPLLLIFLLFPTGRPPSPRWNWVLWLAASMSGLLIILATFAEHLMPMDETWGVTNPIGFLPLGLWDYLGLPWGVLLGVLTAACVAAPFVRYRTATPIERQQIKWLLYACALFAAIYLPTNLVNFGSTWVTGPLWGLAFYLAILAIPLSVAIAILRHRLFDIDIIIRRTLQYTIVTLLLALVYTGSVVLLQGVLLRRTGQGSQVVAVLSTLGIAALFNPLRRRVQRWVDNRFYRSRYDAEQVITAFMLVARDEADLGTIATELVQVIRETLQPTVAGIWFAAERKEERKGERKGERSADHRPLVVEKRG